ncbi:MAG: phosphopantetheine-binding protein [Limisphaerales bacterium]
MVLRVHRRNGGRLAHLNSALRLLDPTLGLDSLDLAEIMVAIEKEFGVSPFDSPSPPRTWADVVLRIQ